jgi:LmbE family N-acetylglucosaminyl deacetylase
VTATLLVVAHPDDEALWFTSVLTRHAPVELVVVTCGGDKDTAERRRRELAASAELYAIAATTLLEQPDVPGRHLDLDLLRQQLQPFAERDFAQVFTHGPLGETFEHPHHRDVCLVVHELFDGVLSTAWNQRPDEVVTLTIEELELKRRAIGSVYWREYVALRPAYEVAAVERFARHPRETVEEIYRLAAARGTRGGEPADLDWQPLVAAAAALAPHLEQFAPLPLCAWAWDEPPPAARDLLHAAGLAPVTRRTALREHSIVALAGLRSPVDAYDAFAALRAGRVLSLVAPAGAIAAAVAEAAATAGYRASSEQLVEPRFEPIGDAVVYAEGASLTLWQRSGRRPPLIRLRRRVAARLRR